MFQCFVNLALRPLLFLWTDQPNRAQPSSLLWSEDCVCSCCVCFVCTNHPHTQWRVNLCWYEATWGLWLQEVQSKAWTHSLSPPPALCYISLSAPCLYMFLGSFWGVSGSPPQRASYWLTRGLLVSIRLIKSALLFLKTYFSVRSVVAIWYKSTYIRKNILRST